MTNWARTITPPCSQGRTLTIMDNERAKTYALTPVKVAGFTNIPIDDEIVTEILPLHTFQRAAIDQRP
jgi:hypothetical protein